VSASMVPLNRHRAMAVSNDNDFAIGGSAGADLEPLAAAPVGPPPPPPSPATGLGDWTVVFLKKG
jgi:hypothetical protein